MLNKQVYQKCYFCNIVKPIQKMIPIVKNIRDWETVKIGGYLCHNKECYNKVQFPFYPEY